MQSAPSQRPGQTCVSTAISAPELVCRGKGRVSRSPCLLAASIALLSYVLMSTFGVGTGVVLIILALILLGWGTGSFLPVNNRQVLARVPMDMQGVGSSTVSTIRVVGQTMGVAMMATVFQSFLVGHPNVGDVASGFAAAMLLGVVMVAIALILVWFTSDPERKEGEKLPVL